MFRNSLMTIHLFSLFIYKVYKKKSYPKNLRIWYTFCNVEDTDLVRMLVKHAHEPTSKLLHPNAVHTQIIAHFLEYVHFFVTLQRKIE